MGALAGFIFLAATGWLVWALIKPESAFWWKEGGSRAKASLYWLGMLFVVAVLTPTPEREQAGNASEATEEVTEAAPETEEFEEGEAKTEPRDLSEENVSLEVDVRIDGSNRAILHGKTNLPDGTILMASVSGVEADFTGSSRTQVQRGQYEVGPFGDESGLKPSTYEARVTMPILRTQDSDEVRRIIGEEGENLRGDLVEESAAGITVKNSTTFQVGSEAEKEQTIAKRQERIAEAEEIIDELRNLLQIGREMEPLRDRSNTSRLRQCGEEMRKYQAEAKDLRGRAEALPNNLAFGLEAAAIRMDRCVSCVPNALQACTQTEEFIEEAEESLLPIAGNSSNSG